MHLFVIYTLVSVIFLDVVSAFDCVSKEGIDYSSLTRKSGEKDWTYKDKLSLNWHVNICENTVTNCESAASKSPVVLWYGVSPLSCYNMAELSNGVWKDDKDGNTLLEFAKGPVCQAVQPPSNFNILIQFYCAEENSIEEISPLENNCRYHVKFNTPEACGDSGSAGAWAFNGIIFCLAGIFLGAFCYKKFVKKEEGPDAVPFYSFWSNLGSLVKEGFSFTFRERCGFRSSPEATDQQNLIKNNQTSTYGATF